MTVILLFRIVISKTGYETAQTEKRLLTQCEVDVHSIDIYMMISNCDLFLNNSAETVKYLSGCYAAESNHVSATDSHPNPQSRL